MKRRRFRFSFTLRTLFVVLTLATAGAWGTLTAFNRRAGVRHWVERGGGAMVYFVPQDGSQWQLACQQLNWAERILGERPMRFVGMPHDATEEDEQRVHLAFPELNAIGRCPQRPTN